MKKYFGWMFAVATCTALTAFAQDDSISSDVEYNEDQVVIMLEEIEDSE